MLDKTRPQHDIDALGKGAYTAAEAARLLKVPARSIRRWLGGYEFMQNGNAYRSPPLWTPQFPANENQLELGFRDVIELRFVDAFQKAGLGLKTIRNCLRYAKYVVGHEFPFSTRRFLTDGRTIFLESAKESGSSELLDLKGGQYAIAQVIQRSFKDLDIEADAVARWRPFKGKDSIVIDPARAFGQPIAAEHGVPTIALADAVKAEGSIDRVARLYEVPAAVVRDAVKFEDYLQAA